METTKNIISLNPLFIRAMFLTDIRATFDHEIDERLNPLFIRAMFLTYFKSNPKLDALEEIRLNPLFIRAMFLTGRYRKDCLLQY